MYLAIDIGGTKTLLAAFTKDGQIKHQFKFPTSKNYDQFSKDLGQTLKNEFEGQEFSACCCAAPGQVNHQTGVVLRFGNLPWQNVRLKQHLESVLNHIPIFVQNDAQLAGLSEALHHPAQRKVLYLTVSTGIGSGIIINGRIDPEFANSEPGQMVIEYNGKLEKWEDLASGRALVSQYGKRASEIEDPAIWQEFAAKLARGMNELIATLQPDLIILGGGVGAHYEKFANYLESAIAKLANPMVPTPPIIKARRAEEAVIYGCYDYIKQNV